MTHRIKLIYLLLSSVLNSDFWHCVWFGADPEWCLHFSQHSAQQSPHQRAEAKLILSCSLTKPLLSPYTLQVLFTHRLHNALHPSLSCLLSSNFCAKLTSAAIELISLCWIAGYELYIYVWYLCNFYHKILFLIEAVL